MSLPSCSHLRIVVGLWCCCLAPNGIAMPMADQTRAPAAIEISGAGGSTDATAEFADGVTTERSFAPRRRPPATPATLIGAHSDTLVDPADRDRMTPAESEAIAFAQSVDAVDDLAFDAPRAGAWFADDDALMARMRGVRDRVSALLDWNINDKINQAGRELLETLGIDDTATTRLMAAEAPGVQASSAWAAQAASRADTPWQGESGRNALGKFLFLIWDTATHPVFLALVFLFVGARAMLSLVRMSTRARARRRTQSRSKAPAVTRHPEPAPAPAPHWARRRRVR